MTDLSANLNFDMMTFKIMKVITVTILSSQKKKLLLLFVVTLLFLIVRGGVKLHFFKPLTLDSLKGSCHGQKLVCVMVIIR